MGKFYIRASVPQNIVMDLNNVMKEVSKCFWYEFMDGLDVPLVLFDSVMGVVWKNIYIFM